MGLTCQCAPWLAAKKVCRHISEKQVLQFFMYAEMREGMRERVCVLFHLGMGAAEPDVLGDRWLVPDEPQAV